VTGHSIFREGSNLTGNDPMGSTSFDESSMVDDSIRGGFKGGR
jgi:hypothetical protein